MTNYREILRLKALGLSERDIAKSVACSRNTVSQVLKRSAERSLSWPLDDSQTDAVLEKLLYPSKHRHETEKAMPDLEWVHKELFRNGVTKKLLWQEYIETCREAGREPLMYSQFCYYIQLDEQKRRASMHISRRPGEQIEVDWAGDPAKLTDPITGKEIDAFVFVGVMSYSQYVYAEAFPDEKQASWIKAHVHMYQFFGGATKILVPDNCKTAVLHNGRFDDPEINAVYREMSEHYNTAIIPARVRSPKDKPNAESAVGNVSTWIIAALRDEKFFTLNELNHAIRRKLDDYNRKPFTKKEGSRYKLFLEEELPKLTPLPAAPYELASWKKATVQYNYHISVEGMLYSVPYECIGKKVDVRVTDSMIEIFLNNDRVASHQRLYGRKGQYSTVTEHMPADHQKYLQWNGDRFRKWAEKIGTNTYKVIHAILSSKPVEQQTYRSCMGLLKLADKYSPDQLEQACAKALSYTASPSYKSIRTIISSEAGKPILSPSATEQSKPDAHGITRGADYYRRMAAHDE